jgi:hypothetical protein
MPHLSIGTRNSVKVNAEHCLLCEWSVRTCRALLVGDEAGAIMGKEDVHAQYTRGENV